VTEDSGFWQFKRIPFGLKNAPSHFQKAIDTILGSYRYEFALAFIDDKIIYSKALVSLVLLDRATSVQWSPDEVERIWIPEVYVRHAMPRWVAGFEDQLQVDARGVLLR